MADLEKKPGPLINGLIEKEGPRQVEYAYQEASLGEGVYWVNLLGQSFVLDLSEDTKGLAPVLAEAGRRADRREARNTKLNKENLLAPMPGKITKILIKGDQVVKAGQVLIVMEAMKMEYSLKAEVDREVAQVFVQELDQVVLGQELLRYKKIE